MANSRLISSLLATTICTSAAALAVPAQAQDTGAPPQAQPPTGPIESTTGQVTGTATNAAEPGNQEIIVTGSRIPQPNLTSAAPVTVVSQQDIKLQGTTRIEDMLNSLPQVSAGQASGVSNDATGAASVDLRGLGVNRTLVLVNGRRLMPGDPNDSSADLNAIPDSLVKRVEVLTGGASSTYGADAVAGVVNFIMDTDFEGIRLDGQYSFYQHNNNNKVLPPLLLARQAQGFSGYDFPTGSGTDGDQINASIAIGAGFDDNRGHVVAYFGYRDVNAVSQANRDYSACTIQDLSATALQCGGSSFSGEGNYLLYNQGTSTFFTTGPNRTLLPGRTRYNFAPTNYFQRPDERYTGGFFAKYEINDAIKPYLEFMFMDDRTRAQIAPSGNFGNTLSINCDNPLIGPQQFAIICAPENRVTGFLGNFPLTSVSNPDPTAPPINFIDPTTGAKYQRGFLQVFRRNVEGGPRVADLQHTQYRGVVGAKGDLNPAFSYDVFYQYGRTNYAQTYFNEQSAARLTRAIDVVSGPGGTPICRSVRDGTDPTCVPYDVLGGTISDAAVAYVAATGFQRAVLEEKIASGSVTGQLGEYGAKLPWANDGVSFNIGLEYRKEKLDLQTDASFQAGDLTGQGAPTLPIKGSFNVKEVFGEVQ
ncbi:MAG: TonB-dependent receptor, partial [Alphaproteobacteria bacterium]|nr:TonB-dependent receptor [Alphaproteobacteria bacterium]